MLLIKQYVDIHTEKKQYHVYHFKNDKLITEYNSLNDSSLYLLLDKYKRVKTKLLVNVKHKRDLKINLINEGVKC